MLTGLDEAVEAGLAPVKLNTVVMGGFTAMDVADLAALSLSRPLEVRFIEYRPLEEAKGCARGSGAFAFVPNGITRAREEERWGPLETLQSRGGS